MPKISPERSSKIASDSLIILHSFNDINLTSNAMVPQKSSKMLFAIIYFYI